RHRKAGAGERLGDAVAALDMADAEQMLHPEQDAPGHASARLSRSTAGRPSRSRRNSCAAGQRNRAGGLPRMSQPVAREKTARITPLWVIAAVGRPAAAISASNGA